MNTITENAANTVWKIDPTHSEILFKVKHLMITNVKGEFQKFDGEILSKGEDFSKASVSVKIDARSIYTNQSDRDNHLRSGDFFDVEKYPEISFKGTSFVHVADDEYKLVGMLTIRGVSKEVSLDVEFGGTMKDPYGNEKAGFSLSGKINRKDWGLNWNTTLEAGGVMVSDDVKINAEVQLVKQ